MPGFIIGAIIAGSVAGSVAAGALAFSWMAFGASLLLGAVSKAMTKKPSASGSTISSGQSGRLVTVRQSIAAWQIIYGQAKVGGVITFFEASSDNQYVHLVVTLAGHECEEIGDIYFNDELVPLDGSGNATGKYAGYARVKKHTGNAADTSQPFADLQTESDGKWTSAHLQRGRAKMYVRLTANPDLYPTGIPNFAAVVKGVKAVTDPRDSSTGWSDNPVLCLEHYLYDTTYGVGATFPTEFETTTIAAEASICDELVTLAGSPTTTEKRYRLNGAFLTSEKPKAVIEIMLAAMAGKAINIGGLWYIYAGAYSTPTVTLTDAHLAGAISVQSHVSRRESCNAVKGVFTDPDNAWQATDFPGIASDTYMADDGGERVWKDIDLSGFVTSGTQAQRLAKIELLKIRQGLSVTGTFKLSAYGCVTGRTVALTIARYGWSAKAFEVVNTRFTYGSNGTLNVELSLRETAAAVYDWSTSEEQTVDIAPNSNLPDPSAVGTPSALTFTADDYLVRGEGDLTWTAPSDALVMEYVVEYKASAASDYNVLSPVTGTSKRITGLQPGDYNCRVKARNYFGVAGSYATLTETIARPEILPVSGLELFDDPLSTTFTGQSAKFEWRANSILWAEGFGEVTGTGGTEYYFKDYEVQIWASGVRRRTEHTTETFYTYTYEKNSEDGSGTPVREFTIKVYKRTRYGDLSATPAQLTVSNTAPTLTNFTLTGSPSAFQFTFDQPTDTDFLKVEVYASQTSGFTANSSTLVYSGASRTREITGLRPSQRYYVKYIPHDKFGAGSTSSEYTVDTTFRSISAWNGSVDGVGNLGQIAVIPVGSSPTGMAWVPASNLLFVVTGSGLDVIDPVTDTKIASITLSGARGVTYCPTNGKLYIPIGGTSPTTLKVVNPTTRAVDATISTFVDASPSYDAVFCPVDGYMYFAGGNRIGVVNPATNAIVREINMYDGAGFDSTDYGIVFCPTNGYIYACAYNDNQVKVINPVTAAVVTTIAVGTNPEWITYCPVNDRIYVTNVFTPSISVIDPGANTVESTITGGSPSPLDAPRDIVYCPGNGLIYQVDYNDNQVNAIRPSDNTIIATTDVNATPYRLCWVPSVKKMYASNSSAWYLGSGTLTSFSV
jgi:YVTN family beta-propeller protein